MSEINGILKLIEDNVHRVADNSLGTIIEYNTGKMNQEWERLDEEIRYFSAEKMRTFISKEGDHSSQSAFERNKKRIRLLKFMLTFETKEHIEMLNCNKFREVLTVESLRLIFEKQNFVNFTIQEKQLNQMLQIQGYFLKNFIYFHMRHDMRFKATIDSTMIDVDNPYTRQMIRSENRADAFLNPKYIVNLNVENYAFNLLDKFFPDIAGIWADHTHNAPYYILEFIKICFEFGFFTVSNALLILERLKRITTNLIKLEEGWLDKLNEVNKFSDMIKASNITTLFAKCRENMAYILVQIIVLLSDTAFIERFPRYLKERAIKSEAAKKKGKKYEWAEFEADVKEDFKHGFCFNDKEVNDAILFITMNYLSNTVYISFQKSMNHDSKEAVEKIFLYITSQNRDTFLNSLKQIKIEDLAYFEEEDIVSKEVRETCDSLGYAMRKLLELIANGEFDPTTGALNKELHRDEIFNNYLKEYVPTDNPTLGSIIKRLLTRIDDGMRKDEHFKVALVKESIPLQLLGLVDYIAEHFCFTKKVIPTTTKEEKFLHQDQIILYTERIGVSKSLLTINKEILSKLNIICIGNNYAKSQIFKGEALYHMKRLMHRYDKDIFLFLNNLCLEDNIGFYLGKDVFTEFLHIYENFNSQILKTIDIKAPAESLNIEKCVIMLLMTKIITKLFKRPFINDREKIQYAMMVQESVNKSFTDNYMVMLMNMLKMTGDKALSKMAGETDIVLTKEIFKDNSESEMVNMLDKKDLSVNNKKILILQVCFNILRMFNIVSSDCYSYIIKNNMSKFVDDIKDYIKTSNVLGKRVAEPFGLDAELITFIKIFEVMPEQHCMMETKVDFSNPAKNDFTGYQDFTMRCIDRVVSYDSHTNLKAEAQVYLFDGLFPLIFKLVNSVKDLTNFDKPQKVSSNNVMVSSISTALSGIIKHLNSIAADDGKEVVPESYINSNKDVPREKPRKASLSGSQVFKDAKSNSDANKSHQTILINACELVIGLLEKFYDKADDEQQERFKCEKDIDHEKFVELELAAKFEDKPSDPKELKRKKGILNSYIKLYYQAKDDYFTRPSEPNLMSYFDRNNQNLRGVFNSCLDRLLNRKKGERFMQRDSSHIQPIVTDYAITKFWFNPACYAYINMLTRLLTQSKSARKQFYNFVREDRLAHDAANDKNLNKQEREQNAKNLEDIRKVTGTRFRDSIFIVLLRIHTDLLQYLNCNASLKPLWWVTHQTYEMISMFFKNLCECNFMEFKEYLADYRTEVFQDSKKKEVSDVVLEKTYGKDEVEVNQAHENKEPYDEGWQELNSLKATQAFVAQLNYLFTVNRISKNKEPNMTHTDQVDKMQALMTPLINLINETITGPCSKNQKVIMGWGWGIDPASMHEPSMNAIEVMNKAQKQASAGKLINVCPIDGIINIAMRVIDEPDSGYSELANSATILLLSLCEGYDSEILKVLAVKIPSSVLVDRLNRFTKKIYIKELILAGKFENIAIEKLSDEMEIEKINDHESNPTNSPSPAETVPTPESRVKEAMQMQNLEEGQFIITEDMESMVEIEDWEDLFDLYMNRPEFSDSKLFQYIFMLMILWRALAKFSKSHESRLEDAKYETEEMFKKSDINLNIFSKSDEEKKKKTKPAEFASIFYFVSNKIMTEIEVVDPTGSPLKIYFPKAPSCYMLSDEAKRSYREGCAITDSNTKMLDLMRNYKLFEILMTFDLRTWRAIGFGFKFLSADAFNRYTYFCWFLGLILNFVLARGVIMDQYGEKMMYRDESYQLTILTIGYFLVAFSSLFLFVWFLFKYQQTYLTRKEDYLFDNPGLDGSSWRVKLYVAIFPAFMSQSFPVNYTLHILFTIVGIKAAYIAIALNLLLVVNISKTAKFVLTSILLHIDQLILTLILAFFIIFSYSVLLGNNLSDHLSKSSIACKDLVNCFFYTVNLGLRNGGGMADSMNTVDRNKMMAERTVFDLTFFMLINVISLNIIFGIIIDTFSQLRDAQNERTIDTKNNCFVCGNTRLDFSKRAINFDDHTEIDHNPWKYIFYIYYLKNKGEDELSGLEYFVWTQYMAKKTNWIPIGNTTYICKLD